MPLRTTERRWRIPEAFVELRLAEGGEAHAHLDRILARFEEFCTLTRGVCEGIDVEVTVKGVHGRVLLGINSFEAGA